MIFRKPTVIQIKAEEDMQDIQPANKSNSQIAPNNVVNKGRLQEIRNQMEIERNSQGQSPYSSELFNNLMSNIRDSVNDME